ncbi:MAG TPA: hypothetical protein VL086_09030 [Candidatus Nitrosotalea sp.]|nr:hypothetical protein [Candidatus Nitrosotalea sp.]
MNMPVGVRLPLRGGGPGAASIGLHCCIAGSPARSPAFASFLECVKQFPGVWLTRRADIARWWLEHQPAARPITST